MLSSSDPEVAAALRGVGAKNFAKREQQAVVDRSRSPFGHIPGFGITGLTQLPVSGSAAGSGKLPVPNPSNWAQQCQQQAAAAQIASRGIKGAYASMQAQAGYLVEGVPAPEEPKAMPLPEIPVVPVGGGSLLFNMQEQAPAASEEQQWAQEEELMTFQEKAAAYIAANAAEEAEAERKRLEEADSTEKLRRSVNSSEGYFQPEQPLGYVMEHASHRYTIVGRAPLGVGVFSVVWPCADADNKLVALKVIRWQDHFRRFAENEVLIMQRVKELRDHDAQGSAQVAMLRDHFVHKVGEVEHLCMSFEKLELNLREAGKQPIDNVLKFGRQILAGLRYLHDVVGLVHCDVKPDNLLLRWDGLSVKLCDFGTARMPTMELQTIDELQPLFYRAPEVFLGCMRGRKIDMWSAGCTIYELAVGRILFRQCKTHRDIVELIMKLCGPIPAPLREQGRLTRAYFSNQGFHPEVGVPVNPEATYKKASMLTQIMPHIDFGKAQARAAHDLAKAQLSKLIGRTTVIGAAQKKKGETESEKRVRHLAELVERCMDVNPVTRITAAQAFEHEAFKAVELPPAADLQEAPPLPAEAPPPLPPCAPPPLEAEVPPPPAP